MDRMKFLISEYRGTVQHCSIYDHENLAQALSQDHDWLDEGGQGHHRPGKQLRLIHAQKRPGPVHCPGKRRR